LDPIITYDEKALFRRIAVGDEAAFTFIFHKYKGPLFTYAMRLTKSQGAAEELVQDCFLKLWTHRQGLDKVENPGGYIHHLARNTGIDFLRRLAVNKQMQQQVWSRISKEENSTELAIEHSETHRMIQQAVSQLTVQQQEVFRLSRYEGLSYEEISLRLGISRNTVKNHLVNSLRYIRGFLQQRYGPVVVLIIMSFLDHHFLGG
jgi:RNA polymerase sigma-70 factor (family 1)